MKRRTIAQCEAEIAALRKRLAQTARFARKANRTVRESWRDPFYRLGAAQYFSGAAADAARGHSLSQWENNRPTYRSKP